MSAALLLSLAKRFWREAVIAALALALVASCEARDHRIAAVAVAQTKSASADSVLRVVTPQVAIHDTAVVHDTVRVRVAVDRVQQLHDTVLAHLTDTVLVREYVSRADSAARACVELANDCAAFRASATAEIAAWKAKAQASTPAAPSRFGLGCAAGPTVLATSLASPPRIGLGASCGVAIRF